MDGYRKAAGLKSNKKRGPRKETIWEMVKRSFSRYLKSIDIVDVSTVPLITERWRDGERQIISFMVTLPRWLPEAKIVEAINLGFGFLEKEIRKEA